MHEIQRMILKCNTKQKLKLGEMRGNWPPAKCLKNTHITNHSKHTFKFENTKTL